MKRDISLNPPGDANSLFYAELQAYASGFDSPRFHVTRSKSWPVSEVKEDDVIWLVAQLSSPWGKLPPSIDGKIIVGGVQVIKEVEGGTKIRYSAKEGSMWFPLVDATTTLSRLQVILKNDDVRTPFDKDLNNLGQAYQSMKKLHNPDVLEDWASNVTSMKFDFISYRIADGTQSAFFHARKQIAKGCPVFWDRWSLPRRLSERRELVSDEALDTLLMNKINRVIGVRVIWAIRVGITMLLVDRVTLFPMFASQPEKRPISPPPTSPPSAFAIPARWLSSVRSHQRAGARR